MRVIGLTGGISTGKSTVSAMLRALGAHVIDSDILARQVVEPGQPAFTEISARFPTVIKSGSLDRAALGARIFAHEDDRAALNAIVHPRVREATAQAIAALEGQGVSLVVNDVPLLIENGLFASMNGVILVVAPIDVQRSRLMARNRLTQDQAQARIDAQLPLDEKRKHARWVIDNGGSLETTQKQVERVWREVTAGV